VPLHVIDALDADQISLHSYVHVAQSISIMCKKDILSDIRRFSRVFHPCNLVPHFLSRIFYLCRHVLRGQNLVNFWSGGFRADRQTIQVFTARRYASAIYAMALCLSVCPCLSLSQVGVLLKLLNLGSRKQHHTIAQGV